MRGRVDRILGAVCSPSFGMEMTMSLATCWIWHPAWPISSFAKVHFFSSVISIPYVHHCRGLPRLARYVVKVMWIIRFIHIPAFHNCRGPPPRIFTTAGAHPESFTIAEARPESFTIAEPPGVSQLPKPARLFPIAKARPAFLLFFLHGASRW